MEQATKAFFTADFAYDGANASYYAAMLREGEPDKIAALSKRIGEYQKHWNGEQKLVVYLGKQDSDKAIGLYT